MTPPFARRSSRGLLGWLGIGADPDAAPTEQPDTGPSLMPTDPIRAARQQLLCDMGQFLVTHDLEVNAFTLAVVHDYLTGTEGLLVRRIETRLQAREPITLEWLEEVAREMSGDQREALTRLMGKLETNLASFDRTSTAARAAATDYGTALEAHVGELRQPYAQISASAVANLVTLASGMLVRTRDLEQEMARSVLETKALRRSLELARRSAERDHLTGLPNRRAFENRYASEYAAAKAAGDQLCVAFCDIDHFKRINDEHGHEAGDRVLKTVATSLSRISDLNCHVARHGGEEFVVLLRGRSLHAAWELLDEARQQMAQRHLVNRNTDTPFGKVTFSGGLADVFAFGDPRSALRAADKALYRAKAEGRNRIVIATANDVEAHRPAS